MNYRVGLAEGGEGAFGGDYPEDVVGAEHGVCPWGDVFLGAVDAHEQGLVVGAEARLGYALADKGRALA